MREYETVFILKPNTPEKDIEEFKERLIKLIGQHKGQVLVNRSWGKRQLSYPIAKEKEGVYIHLDYTGEGTLIVDLEKVLRLDERVIRFLTVVLQEEVDVEKRMKELSDAEAALQTAAQTATA